jgi:hypothetical protein
MLTGTLARDGSIAELAQASLPVAPSRINPSLPPEVDEVLLRSLDPAPAARYPSMDAFVGALRSALPVTVSRQPSPSSTRYQTPETTYTPLPPGPERRRLPVLLTLITLLVFAASFAAAYAVTALVS